MNYLPHGDLLYTPAFAMANEKLINTEADRRPFDQGSVAARNA
jgi:hypothetical protein